MSMNNSCSSCNDASSGASQTITCCGTQSVTTKSNMAVSGIASATASNEGEITFSISIPPTGGAAFVDYSSGGWSYTPNPGFVGMDTFTIKAANTDCISCSITIDVEVQAQAPCCSPLTPVTMLAAGTVSGLVKATDPQNQTITFQASAQPVNGTLELNPISGNWSYTADDGFTGEDSFSVRVTNQNGLYCDKTQAITVVSFCPELSKTASTENVCVGCTFNYLITAANKGTAAIESCVIKDDLPPQLEVVMLQLNGTRINENLSLGINTGSIAPGAEALLLVTVKVMCDSLVCPYRNAAKGVFKTVINPCDPPAQIVREAIDCNGITVRCPRLKIENTLNQESAAVGEVLTFSLLVKNNGNVALRNVTIIDPLDNILQFQSGSLIVNTISKPDENIAAGVMIPSLNVNETVSIIFDATIISQGQGTLENQTIGTFDYWNGGDNALSSGTAVSNILKILVKNPCLQIEKKVDKSLSILGDFLTYTITITNCGDIDAQNAVLKDTLSQSVILIKDTFKINGKTMNDPDLRCGVYLGNIPVNNKVTIQYMVRVVSMNCEGFIANEAFVSFGYSTGPCVSVKRINSQTASTKTCLAISLFKQLNIKSNLCLCTSKPGIEQINSVTGRVSEAASYVIETPVSRSREGQNLTGYKLIVHGILNLEVEYTADDSEQTVFSEIYSEPFSSFVVLHPEYQCDSPAKVKAVVENISFKQTSNRCFYTNTTMLLIVNTK